MAKNSIRDFSATASSNTDIQSVDIDENCAASGINNAIRELMADIADFNSGTVGIDVLSLADDDNSAQIKIQAPSAVTTTTTFTMPDGDGSSGQFLKTDGSGNLSFAVPSGSTDASDLTSGTLASARLPAGSVLQVVQGTTSTAVSNATGSFVDTGLTATITPSSTSSKIMVLVQQQGCNATLISTGCMDMRLQRNSSDIHNFATAYFFGYVTTSFRAGISSCFLDSPSTTSATAYKTVFRPNNGGTSTVQNDGANSVSTITLMEIAG